MSRRLKDENGVCANCGERIWRTHSGRWKHCYVAVDRCDTGKKTMARKSREAG